MSRAWVGVGGLALLSGCLSISADEAASRERVASLVGDYAGSWSLDMAVGSRSGATCAGEGSGAVSGDQWGDPLTLRATFACSSEGLVSYGAGAEVDLAGGLDGTIGAADSAAADLSGDLEVTYLDKVGTPTWSGSIEEGDLPVITAEFSGSVPLARLGTVDYTGTFTLTHNAWH